MFGPGVRGVSEWSGPVERWLLGVDYGTAGTPAAHLLAVDDLNQRIIVADEWRWVAKDRQRQLTDVEMARELERWLEQRPWKAAREPFQTVVDPSATSFIAQLHRSGWSGVRLAHNEVPDGIRSMASLLGTHHMVVSARCPGLIRALPG